MAADAASLHCPNCGAAADSAASRCPYCQARLATVSCPQHAIVDFIQGGGLERTREKEIADLREEQRRLDAARARARSPSPGSGRVELGTWNAGDLRHLLASLGLGKNST